MPRARSQVAVREAGEEDVPVLVGFGEALRDSGALPRRAARLPLAELYTQALDDPERRVVLAVGDAGEPLGMAIFVRAPATSLLEVPALHVTHVVVDDRHRRRGAGRALLAAAATQAEELGLEQVVVSVPPGDRDANRFYARLGFAPLVMRRVAPAAPLKRRLTGEHEQVSRRRALRR
ncbi:MAG: GNAT family N-acetyltransferase [Actinomycetota bacterium]|nr:GNAT family N-acetyltransferase [Actinomycetota bacterium]